MNDLDKLAPDRDRFKDMFFQDRSTVQNRPKNMGGHFSKSFAPKSTQHFNLLNLREPQEDEEEADRWFKDDSSRGRKVSVDNIDKRITIAKIREHNTVLKNVNNLDEENQVSEVEQSVFKRVTIMIESHLSDEENLFKILINKFQNYLVDKYNPVLNQVKLKEIGDDELADINTNLCNEINDFTKIVVKCLILFYNFDISNFRVGNKAQKEIRYLPCTILNFDNLMNYATVMMFPEKVYSLVLEFMLEKNYSKDKKFSESLAKNQNSISMSALGIEEKFRLQESVNIGTNEFIKVTSKYSYTTEKGNNYQNLRVIHEEGDSLPKSNHRRLSEMDPEEYERKTMMGNLLKPGANPVAGLHRTTSSNLMADDPLKDEPYKDAIKTLRFLEEVESPFEKMKVLLLVIRKIIKAINEHYNGRVKEKIEVVTGDQIMSLTVYVVLKARVNNMPTYIEFIETFLPPKMFNTFCGYYLTVFQAACEYITEYHT